MQVMHAAMGDILNVISVCNVTDIKWRIANDFLLLFHINSVQILYRLRDIARHWSKMQNFYTTIFGDLAKFWHNVCCKKTVWQCVNKTERKTILSESRQHIPRSHSMHRGGKKIFTSRKYLTNLLIHTPGNVSSHMNITSKHSWPVTCWRRKDVKFVWCLIISVWWIRRLPWQEALLWWLVARDIMAY